MLTIGDRIRTLREQRGLLQRDLAEKSGVSQVTISYYEIGKRKPNAVDLEKIAKVLDYDIRLFFPGYYKEKTEAADIGWNTVWESTVSGIRLRVQVHE